MIGLMKRRGFIEALLASILLIPAALFKQKPLLRTKRSLPRVRPSDKRLAG